MNQQLWNRRDFVKATGMAAIPALIATPSIAVEPARTEVADEFSSDHPFLWAEAGSTIEFYRRHLPNDLRLGNLTCVSSRDIDATVRILTVPIVEIAGQSQVGSLTLNATFSADQARTLLWQSTKVAGAWYSASIANSFRAGLPASMTPAG